MTANAQTGFGSGKWDPSAALGLKNKGNPLTEADESGILNARHNEVLQKREATFLARSHRKIAIQNVGGGLVPSFDNTNLYGFALMTFTGGWDSGWNVIDIKSVLKPPVTASLTGGDDVANVSSYFFNVNPKSISLSEPSATHITPTQNNGFYVESQGVVLRRLAISGTTGYRPSASKLPDDQKLPKNPDEPTGFLNHVKLRNLFRNYSSLKKNPKAAKNTYMVWYNGLTQEAWFCEPESFSSARDASSPFISRYEIGATLLHKVAFSAISVKLSPSLMGEQFNLESIRLASVLLNRDSIPDWLKTVKNVAQDLGFLVKVVGDAAKTAEQYMSEAISLGGSMAGMLPALIVPALQAYKNAAFNIRSIVENSRVLAKSTGDITQNDLDEWWEDFGANYSTVLTDNIHSTSALLLEVLEKGGSNPTNNLESDNAYYGDFSGKVNYEIPDDDYTYIEGIIPDNIQNLDTLIGNHEANPATKPLFFAVNKLKYPYVSAIPSSNTVSAGDTVYIPYPNGKKVPANVETKLFPLNIKLGLYQELLGRDIKLTSMVTGSGQKKFDFSISDTGDLDLIESNDNMIQAIYIKLNIERGELDLHPWFGLIDVVGMKSNLNLSFATNLAINDTMLSDGRIESISGLTIAATGDQMDVKLNAHIIGNSLVPVAFGLGV